MVMAIKERKLNTCKECGYQWCNHRDVEHPRSCPNCRTILWKRERKLLIGVASKVNELRKKNPCATLQQIGNQCGVTRERVRQILKKNELKTRHFTQTYICNNCGKETKKRLFCDLKCYIEYHSATLECHTCGKLFKRCLSSLKRAVINGKQYYFCCRSCRSKWAGKQPKHSYYIRKKRVSKYQPLVPAIKEQLASGKSLNKVIKELNIPMGNWSIIKRLVNNSL